MFVVFAILIYSVMSDFESVILKANSSKGLENISKQFIKLFQIKITQLT